MKVIDCSGKTDQEWLVLRSGRPTASELHRLITPKKLELAEGDGPRTYVAEKLAERWRGGPLQAFRGTPETEQGEFNEETAISMFEAEHKIDLLRRRIVTTDSEDFGATPDGLFPDGSGEGAEVKSPQPVNHVKWLLAGVCPTDHFLQCQGGMYATGGKRWWFVSYCQSFPRIKIEVPRDESLMETIAEAVALCNQRIVEGYAILVAKNGGEPKRRVPRPPAERDEDPFGVGAPDLATDQMNQRITDQHFLREKTQ